MPTTTPLTDAIEALTRYANETTGAGDTTLSEAVNTLVEGYGQGGGSSDKWQRPSEFPDYSKVDLTNQEVLYYTYKTGTDNSYAFLRGSTTSGSVTYDVGTLNNGDFTVLDTDVIGNNALYFKDLSGYQYPYVVVRATGNIKAIGIYNVNGMTVGDRTYGAPYQYMVEAYGRLPKCTSLSGQFRSLRYIKSATLYGLSSLTDMSRAFGDCSALENVYIADTTQSISLYYAFSGDYVLRYLWLNEMHVSNFQNAFQACRCAYYHDVDKLKLDFSSTSGQQTYNALMFAKGSLDLSSYSPTITTCISMFQDCYLLKELDIHTWTFSGSAQGMFMGSGIESIPQADYSGVTNTSNMFNNTKLIGSVTMPITADTQFRTAFQYCGAVRSITIPAIYTGQIVAQAFRDTASLTEIHFLATTPPSLANKNAFWYGTTNASRKIYVPYSEDHSVLNAYQTASVWSTIDCPIVEEPQGE